jgi:hypothetical protein
LNNVNNWFNALKNNLIHFVNLTAQHLANVLKVFKQSANQAAKKIKQLLTWFKIEV